LGLPGFFVSAPNSLYRERSNIVPPLTIKAGGSKDNNNRDIIGILLTAFR